MKKVYLIAMIAALLAAFASYLFAQGIQNGKKIENADTTDVYVALSDVPDGTVIDKDNFDSYFIVKNVVDDYLTPQAVAKNNKVDVIGNVSTRTIYAGEQLSMTAFAQQSSEEIGLSYKLDKGEVAYTLKADKDMGVDGYVTVGDVVDIVCNYKEESTDEKKYPTPNKYNTVKLDGLEVVYWNDTVLQFKDLEVIAVGSAQENEDEKAEGTGEVNSYTTITVKTTEAVAEQLFRMEENAEGSNQPNFKIVLKSRSDASGSKEE